MNIQGFVRKSEGEWASMRSSHSLAFKQFEQILSKVKIEELKYNESEVIELLKEREEKIHSQYFAFRVKWEAESDWEEDDNQQNLSGLTTIIAIPNNNNQGIFIKSSGYTESGNSISTYNIDKKGLLLVETKYDNSLVEERIWFVSENVRCRSSVIKTLNGKGIIQTSYASELRKLNL